MYSFINIVGRFSKDFVKLVLVAVLVATPLAWHVMKNWLEEFAYKTGISIWVIALAIVSCLGLAVMTIFFQTYKSIQANPVNSLKSE